MADIIINEKTDRLDKRSVDEDKMDLYSQRDFSTSQERPMPARMMTQAAFAEHRPVSQRGRRYAEGGKAGQALAFLKLKDLLESR